MRVLIISCDIGAPHLILPCTYHLAMSSCIILRIASTCIDLCYTFLYVLFGSSRVDADAEQYEQEYEHPQEDRACASTADLTGEPTSSPILHLHALLIYCYPYVAILLCHVSYFHLLPIYPRYTSSPTYCLLFASFASRRRV